MSRLENQSEYSRKFHTKYPFNNSFYQKVNHIKRKYGKEAKVYFLKIGQCERCQEKRLGLLDVHHPEGKKIKKFQILCKVCHFTHHAKLYKGITLEDIYFSKYNYSKKTLLRTGRTEEITNH